VILLNPGPRELHILQGAKDSVVNHGVLVKLFNKIKSVVECLEIYTQVPPSPAVTNELAKVMAEVLIILALATKGIMERRTSGSIFSISYSSLN
jgi:hypothetical protein